MAIYKLTDIQRLTQPNDNFVSAILLFGPNEAKIRLTARQIIINIVGSLDDPFSIDTLEEKQIKDAPGILRDQAMSMSFTGDRKIIYIKEPGPSTIKQIPDYLTVKETKNILLIEASNLTKSAALRKLFEKSKNAACIAFYDDTPAELINFITEQCAKFNKKIDQTTARVLVESVGNHRGLIEQEIEKLINYCQQADQITIDDIKLLSGDPLAESIENLCDTAILGQSDEALVQVEQLILTGTQAAQILNVISMHLVRLLSMKSQQNNGQPIDNLIRYARPPIFFKRQQLVKRQLTSWQSKSLKAALKTVFQAIAQTRRNPELSFTICERTILNLGRLSRTR